MIAPFTWSAATGQYRDARGRFVPRSEIRAVLDRAIDQTQRNMLAVSNDFRAGRITLEEWRSTMAAGLKDSHLYSASAAKGGWAQMTQKDYGRVGKILQRQYTYLENFTTEIVSGVQPLDGRFMQRVKLYAQSSRGTYHKFDREMQARRGMAEMRNIIRPGENCDGCLEMTALGWVEIGDPEYIDIGSRQCLSNCRCTEAFR